jgi:hypothetical protein
VTERENPATTFIAVTLCEYVHGDWANVPDYVRDDWTERAGHLLRAMYAAGFTIPQPDDPDRVWNELKAKQ